MHTTTLRVLSVLLLCAGFVSLQACSKSEANTGKIDLYGISLHERVKLQAQPSVIDPLPVNVREYYASIKHEAACNIAEIPQSYPDGAYCRTLWRTNGISTSEFAMVIVNDVVVDTWHRETTGLRQPGPFKPDMYWRANFKNAKPRG